MLKLRWGAILLFEVSPFASSTKKRLKSSTRVSPPRGHGGSSGGNFVEGTEDTGLSRSGPADLMTTKRKSQAKASDLKPQQAADTLLGNEPLGLTVNLDRSAEPEDAYDFNIDYA